MRRAARLVLGYALAITSFATPPLAAQSVRNDGRAVALNGEWLGRMPFDDVFELLRFTPGSLTRADHTSFGGLHPRFLLNDQPASLLLSPDVPLLLPLQAVDSVVVWRSGGGPVGIEVGAPVSYHLRPTEQLKAQLSAATDRFVGATSSGLTRVSGSLGGTVPFLADLRFSLSADLIGHSYSWAPDADDGGRFYQVDGIDTMIRMPRVSSTSGAVDSVDVPIPHYAVWERNQLSPLGQDDRYSTVAQLEAPVPGGAALLTFHRGRTQTVQKEFSALFNPDANTGEVSTRNLVQLQVRSTLGQGLRVEAAAAWQGLDVQRGLLTPGNELHPELGFRFAALDFDFDRAAWPVTDRLVRIARSGLLAVEDHRRAPDRVDLAATTSFPGVALPLNLNPWGASAGFSSRNAGNVADTWSSDRQWSFRGTIQPRAVHGHLVTAGVDMTSAAQQSRTIQRYAGFGELRDIGARRAALFAQDEFHGGSARAVIGVRVARYTPDAELPRVPGYVFNVPDSLSLGMYELRSGTGHPYDRLYVNDDCGGDATASLRRRASTSEIVCKSNFVPMQARTEVNFWSNAEWKPSSRVTLLASVRQQEDAAIDAATFAGANADLALVGNGTVFPRELAPVRSRILALGGSVQLTPRIGIHLDVQQNVTSNSRVIEWSSFEDPFTGRTALLRVTSANQETDLRTATLLASYSGNDAQAALGYTYLDEEAGSDRAVILLAPRIPPHALSAMVALSPAAWSNSVVLRGTSLHVAFRARSGFSYTPLQNEAIGGIASDWNSPAIGVVQGEQKRSPLTRELNLRVERAVEFGEHRLKLFIDARNPFGFTTTRAVFVETGTSENEALHERFVNQHLTSSALDGDVTIDDIVIASEGAPGNVVNRYMLRQAEARFGNGDGIFTVEEQRATYTDLYRLLSGVQQFEHNNRLMRIGLSVVF